MATKIKLWFLLLILEKYTRGVSAVESILTLDRLRQNVAVKELLQAQGQPLMRKTASVPNFSQVLQLFLYLGHIVCFLFHVFNDNLVSYRINFWFIIWNLLFLNYFSHAVTGYTRIYFTPQGICTLVFFASKIFQ